MNLRFDALPITHFLEALYDLEQPRDDWFRGTLGAAGTAFDRGDGVGMLLYDASGEAPRLDAIDGVNIEPGFIELGQTIHRQPELAQAILNTYRNVVCTTLPEQIGTDDLQGMEDRYAEHDVRDQILINGGNPDGLGCVLYVFSSRRIELGAESSALFARIASHLSTAYRLHRRLHDTPRSDTGGVEAVLRVDGRVEHANGELKEKPLLRHLSAAVGRREWAKSGEAGNNSDRTVAAWQPMVAARWSLVDAYEKNGVRYVTARENSPVRGGVSLLSAREQQVTSLAALGHSNKLIAYELGLAHSTVRVLFTRAAAKLGARTRAEVIERVRGHVE